MQHLDTERLAALDHEPPTDAELVHLAACAACRAEREAFAALTALAAGLRAPDATVDAPRLTEWRLLADRLHAEGLLRGEPAEPVRAAAGRTVVVDHDVVRLGDASGRRPPSPSARGLWLRAAAALAFTLGGAVLGRATAGGAVSPDAPVIASAGDAVADAAFASVEDATNVLARAQQDYERASRWLAANDPTPHSSQVYRARLAALDQMMAASRAALFEAPQDPVLNQYYLAAWNAREATLQQLGDALPVHKTLNRF